MILLLKFLCAFYLFELSFAKSEAEIRNHFIALGLQCNQENPITPEDMAMLHQHKIPDNENAKCLLACVYRKSKWLDDKGMLDLDYVKSHMEKEHEDDATKHEASIKLFEICKKVNDEAVSDGEKGCQRSALLTECLTTNAPQVGLEVPV